MDYTIDKAASEASVALNKALVAVEDAWYALLALRIHTQGTPDFAEAQAVSKAMFTIYNSLDLAVREHGENIINMARV